jgi:hypothetical protein
MSRRVVTTRELDRLREMAAAGMTSADASRALGRNGHFASDWAKRLGITFQPWDHLPLPRLRHDPANASPNARRVHLYRERLKAQGVGDRGEDAYR